MISTARARNVERVLETLAEHTARLKVPAVERISQSRAVDPFRTLIATLLSARTQDATTEAACGRLFSHASDPAAMDRLSIRQIERSIYPVSFYRHKARHIKGTCRRLLMCYGGSVPRTLEELTSLPGVGRKTATLVLILAFRSDSHICVDTHVHRIANRLGWTRSRTPLETEQALYRVIPARWWPLVNLYLVTWGQHVCRPVYPRCSECAISAWCPRLGVTAISNHPSPAQA